MTCLFSFTSVLIFWENLYKFAVTTVKNRLVLADTEYLIAHLLFLYLYSLKKVNNLIMGKNLILEHP